VVIVGLGATASSLIEDERIRACYRPVAAGVGNHGTFLRSFALAVVNADAGNFVVLKQAAQYLIKKFQLTPDE
jgi:hypothetical protein